MKTFYTTLLAFLVLVGVIFGVRSMRTVDASQSCAWVRFGKVIGEAATGFQFTNPFNSKACYPRQSILFQTAADATGDGKVDSKADYFDFPVEIKTSDGQSAMLEFNLKFHVEPACAVTIRKTIATSQNDLVMRVVNNFSRSIPRDIAPEFTATQLYGKDRNIYEANIKAALIPLFTASCVSLDEFILRDINFDQKYEDTMEQKQIQMENVTVQKHIAEQAVENAKATVTNAQAAADAQIESARGQAETTRLMAIAEAEAIRVKGDALKLNPAMLSYKFFDALAVTKSLVPWSAIQGYLPLPTPLP
jgi:regulator of protease activity HflC (stomatin/prohibitin superfamily)